MSRTNEIQIQIFRSDSRSCVSTTCTSAQFTAGTTHVVALHITTMRTHATVRLSNYERWIALIARPLRLTRGLSAPAASSCCAFSCNTGHAYMT